MTSLICMIGASGFLGGRTLRRAHCDDRIRLRVLVHGRAIAHLAAVESVRGDAADQDSLERLLEPEAVALNFAYGGDEAGERIARALGGACARRKVRRLVHVSTCSVYGTTPGQVIDEASPCAPATTYERAKRAVEEILQAEAHGRYELVILRPTAVFGPGGKNLETLALRVLRQSWPRRYLRACAMGRRRMHAVDVECVAAAALFLASAPLEAPVERFIVSQDDEPMNDYRSIEAFFVRRFGAAPYPLAPVAPPPFLLLAGLRLAGRSVTEPLRSYSAAKLASRGFRKPRGFQDALEEYAAWLQQRETDQASHARA